MRRKTVPKKRGRAEEAAGTGEAATGGGEPRVRAAKRPRPGAPRAVESVRCAPVAPADLLAFADVLFATPAVLPSEAAGSGDAAAAEDGGDAAAACAAPPSLQLALAPGERSRLLLSWDADSGGPEAPVGGWVWLLMMCGA